MRLAAPGHLVDINRLGELAHVTVDGGAVRVGAIARHAAVGRDAAASAALPLLRQATGHVARPASRNRRTTVGSLVHADPAAELPAVLSLLSGSVTLASVSGRRTVPAGEFFVGPLESALRPGELAVEALFPVPPNGSGTAWLEVSRRRGDFAVCGVGVLVTLSADRRVAAARAAYVSVGPTPLTVDLAEAVAGLPADTADWARCSARSTSATACSAGTAPRGSSRPSPHTCGTTPTRRRRRRARRSAGTCAGARGTRTSWPPSCAPPPSNGAKHDDADVRRADPAARGPAAGVRRRALPRRPGSGRARRCLCPQPVRARAGDRRRRDRRPRRRRSRGRLHLRGPRRAGRRTDAVADPAPVPSCAA